MAKLRRLITHNFWLKVLSLALAIVTWLYVTWQLEKAKREQETALFSMIHYDIILRALPIEVTIAGKPKDGYEVKEKGITIEPKECLIVGPKNILTDVKTAKTLPLDISGYSKDLDKRVSLAPLAGGIISQDEFIKVHIPIVKKEEPAAPAEAK